MLEDGVLDDLDRVLKAMAVKAGPHYVVKEVLPRLHALLCDTNGGADCRETALAMTKIEEAGHWLTARR